MNLLQIVEETNLEPAEIALRTAQIHAAILSGSEYLGGANFTRIHNSDLALLFTAYDSAFFAGQIRATLGECPLRLVFSPRMTSAAGKTVTQIERHSGRRRYEIGIATSMLFGCFRDDDHRPITASGIECRDRLQALQRVMEHEIVHLVEMLLWDASSCSSPRYHSITRRFFGHLENTHRLITPKERAQVKFGIRPGVKVRFRHHGVQYTGVVNRVSKRATVLVENADGKRYSDGKHYTKFYVPPPLLEAVE